MEILGRCLSSKEHDLSQASDSHRLLSLGHLDDGKLKPHAPTVSRIGKRLGPTHHVLHGRHNLGKDEFAFWF